MKYLSFGIFGGGGLSSCSLERGGERKRKVVFGLKHGTK